MTLAEPTERRLVRRTFDLVKPPTIRAAADGSLIYRGYASVFEQPSVEMYGMREYVAHGAFDVTLASSPRVLFLHNHNRDLVLSSTDNLTLELSVDATGLLVVASWAPVTYAQDIAVLYRDGYLSQMSFGFWIVHCHREQRNGEMALILDELDLDEGDVSTVAYAAYPQTSGEMRARGAVALLRTAFPDLELDDDAALRSLGGTPVPETRTAAPKPSRREIPPAPDSRRLKRAVAGALIGNQERSLNGWTFGDLFPLLDDAVVDSCSSDDFNAYWYVWVVDASDEWLIYYDGRPGAAESGLWQCPYTVDAAGLVTLGAAFPVLAKTSYLPDTDDDQIPEGIGTEPGVELAAAPGPAASGDAGGSLSRARLLALRERENHADFA